MSALENRCHAQRHRPGLVDLLRHLRHAAAAEARALARHLQRRHRVRRLLDLDDALLTDIGVTREEVRWAARLPLDVNAALALRQRAAGRREEDARWLQSRAARRRRQS